MWLGALTQFSLLVGGTWWIFEEFCLDCIGFLLSLACYGLKVFVFSVFRVFSFLNACQFFKWLFGLDWDMDGPIVIFFRTFFFACLQDVLDLDGILYR